MSRKETDLTPEEVAFIKETVRQVAFLDDPEIYGSAIIFLIRELGKNPIQQVEASLRELGSQTYLLALPAAFFTDLEPKLIHSGEACPYGLSICVAGAEEAWERMVEHETTPEENYANLAQTGLLIPRKGTEFSRMGKAKYN